MVSLFHRATIKDASVAAVTWAVVFTSTTQLSYDMSCRRAVRNESHTRTVVRECCKSDDQSQWKRANFDTPATSKPLNRSSPNLHTWLCLGRLPPCKISFRSDKGFRFRACATSRTTVYSAIFIARPMVARSWESNFVRLSVTRVLCDWFKEPTGNIFIPHERAIILVF